MLRFTLVGLFLPLIPALASPVNLIVNGSFEADEINPWFQNVDGVRPPTCGSYMAVCEFWNTTQAAAHSGTYSSTDVGNLEMRQNFAPVPTSDITQFGFWVMNPNSFSALIGYELFYSDDPDPFLYFNYFVQTLFDQNWTYIDMTPNLQRGTQLVGIGIGGYDRAPSTPVPRLFVDDVVLSVTTPEPTSSGLVAAGVAALTLASARRQRRRM